MSAANFALRVAEERAPFGRATRPAAPEPRQCTPRAPEPEPIAAALAFAYAWARSRFALHAEHGRLGYYNPVLWPLALYVAVYVVALAFVRVYLWYARRRAAKLAPVSELRMRRAIGF